MRTRDCEVAEHAAIAEGDLAFAVDNRFLPVNPTERIVLPRRKQFEARFLTPDELELLAATIDALSRAMVLVTALANAPDQ